MLELIREIPHDKPVEDHDKEHDPAVCLRCRMEWEWKRVDAHLRDMADQIDVLLEVRP
jgi:hypothetical protein